MNGQRIPNANPVTVALILTLTPTLTLTLALNLILTLTLTLVGVQNIGVAQRTEERVSRMLEELTAQVRVRVRLRVSV